MKNDELVLDIFIRRPYGEHFHAIKRVRLDKAVVELSDILQEKYNIDCEVILRRYNSTRRGPRLHRLRRKR